MRKDEGEAQDPKVLSKTLNGLTGVVAVAENGEKECEGRGSKDMALPGRDRVSDNDQRGEASKHEKRSRTGRMSEKVQNRPKDKRKLSKKGDGLIIS